MYNETVIDISLVVAYHKFRHQNKKTTVYRLLVCLFPLASISDVMSIFRRRQRFFPLFLLAAVKSALSILTVKCRVLLTLISSALRNLTAPWQKFVDTKQFMLEICHKAPLVFSGHFPGEPW